MHMITFADAISEVQMRSYWVRVDPSARMTGVPMRKDTETERDTRKEVHVLTEAEIRMTQPQAGEHQGLTASTRNWERRGRIPPWRLQREDDPADFLMEGLQSPNLR